MTIDVTEYPTADDLETADYLFAPGTVGDDGLIYFPESYADGEGVLLIVDPSDNSSQLVSWGSGFTFNVEVGYGHLLPSGKILYTLNNGYNVNARDVFLIDPGADTVTNPSLTGTDVSTGAASSELHSNGYLYIFHTSGGSGSPTGVRVTKVNPASLAATSAYSAVLSGTIWYPAGACEGDDGLIYAATGFYHFQATPGTPSTAHDPPILIYDPSSDSITFSHMGLPALAQKQFYAASVKLPDGRIVFIPGKYSGGDPDYPAMIVDPGAGSASLQSTTLPPIPFRQGGNTLQRARLGADGRIYYPSWDAGPDTPLVVAYDPDADTFETWTSPDPGVYGDPPFWGLAVTPSGVLFGVPSPPATFTALYSPANRILRIPGGGGFSFYVGDIPVSLYVGDISVTGWYF